MSKFGIDTSVYIFFKLLCSIWPKNDRCYYQLIYFHWRHNAQNNGIQNNNTA